MKFAVVIPACNAERFIKTAIASALNQSHRPEIVVVVENGSTDRTYEVVKEIERSFRDRLCVTSLRQPNTANARNFGIQRAIDLVRPDIISFLDADDFWHPNKLKNEARIFESDPSAGAVYSFSDFVSDRGEFLYCGNRTPHEGWVFEELFKRFFLDNGSAFSMRSSILRSSLFKLPFDPRYTCAADLDFALKLSRITKFRCTNSVNIYYRQHPQQATQQRLPEQKRDSIAILNKHAKLWSVEHLLPEAIARVEQYIKDREGERRVANDL